MKDITLFGSTKDNTCVPFRIAAPRQIMSGFIGGMPPKKIIPSSSVMVFLATMPLDVAQEKFISIFIDPDSLFNSNYIRAIRSISDVNIDIIVHDWSNRSRTSKFKSMLSAGSLSLLDHVEDKAVGDLGDAYINDKFDGHKLGGTAFLLSGNRRLLSEINSIEAKGYFHFLQLGPPAFGDYCLDGNWPFRDGYFHLYTKSPCEKNDWLVWWEF